MLRFISDRLPDAVTLPQRHADYVDVFHIFAIRTEKRDALRNHLADKGIATEVHYPVLPHKQPAMQDVFEGDWPIATLWPTHKSACRSPSAQLRLMLKLCAMPFANFSTANALFLHTF